MKLICLITFLFLHVLALGVEIAKHGEPKQGKRNAYATMVAFAINMLLLWGAGLFSNF